MIRGVGRVIGQSEMTLIWSIEIRWVQTDGNGDRGSWVTRDGDKGGAGKCYWESKEHVGNDQVTDHERWEMGLMHVQTGH